MLNNWFTLMNSPDLKKNSKVYQCFSYICRGNKITGKFLEFEALMTQLTDKQEEELNSGTSKDRIMIM